ncbi:MAG TPA: S24/S26 family peptidase [Thermoanaerobaculia bacterium]|nr:S24/S26 family peptidase [Thermoanaerobaculia bacterium]
MSGQAEVMVAAILESGYTARIRVDGDSMHPLLRSGDALIVEPVVTGCLRAGDIVLARLDRGLTAHRVIRVDREAGRIVRITSRGDNCVEADPSFTPERILGRVISREREGAIRPVRSSLFAAILTASARRRGRVVRARIGRFAGRLSSAMRFVSS